jgi:hypothetical protein
VDTPELQKIQQGLNNMLGEATQASKEAAYNRRWFKAEEGAAQQGLAETGISRLKGLWFEPAEARQITQDMMRQQGKPGKFFGALESVGSIMRTAETTADLSAPFIQGIPRLLTNPVQFLQSFAGMLHAAVDTNQVAKFMGGEEAARAYAVFPNLGRSNTEVYQGANLIEAGAGKLPVVGGPVQAGVGQVLGRAQAAFDQFGNIARVKWANSLADLAQRSGQTTQIGDFLNHATGITSTAGMGVSPQTRAVETGLFFAPRFLRATLALVGDALQGGAAGHEAQKTLASMAAVGTTMYVGISKAIGQDPILDPTDSRFMTWDIMGKSRRHWWSLHVNHPSPRQKRDESRRPCSMGSGQPAHQVLAWQGWPHARLLFGTTP